MKLSLIIFRRDIGVASDAKGTNVLGMDIVQHEAGHFLIAYLLGVLPKGYTLTSLEALIKEGSLNVQAGTTFVDFEFLEELRWRPWWLPLKAYIWWRNILPPYLHKRWRLMVAMGLQRQIDVRGSRTS